MSRPYYRWVIVAAGGLLGCVAIGAMFSLPVFLRPISRETGWSITGVSSAMTFGFLAMAVGSIVWGNLSDRFGPRPISADRIQCVGHSSSAGEPGDIACRVSADLRRGCRRCGSSPFAPMMSPCVNRLVRHTSQPCCVSRICRHGNGANDHVSLGGAAHFQPRLENVPPNPRRTHCRRYDSNRVAGASPTGLAIRKCRPCRT